MRIYELYKNDNNNLGELIGKFSRLKDLDDYIKNHPKEKFIYLDKPAPQKFYYNPVGGKEYHEKKRRN